jgi:DNA-binding NarL/FixJ family response regulator
MRVLIVDDSEVFVHRLASSLAGVTGIEIVGYANNVADAIEEIRKAKPDVVILDIRIPGGSGIDVLAALKEDQFKPIVIVLSNYGFPQYRRKCLRSGARFFIDKSAEFHKVAEVLRSLMEATAA